MQLSDTVILAVLAIGGICVALGLSKFILNRKLLWGLVSTLGVALIAVALVERIDFSVAPRDFTDDIDHLEATAEEQLQNLRSTAKEYLPGN